MIKDYFQLTTKLIHDYIGSTHERNVQEEFRPSHNVNQYLVYQDQDRKTLLMIIDIVLLAEKTQIISIFSTNDDTTEKIRINWDDIDQVEFPIDEINISNDLIVKFNDHIKKNERDERLKQLFKTCIKSPKVKAVTGSNQADLKPRIDLSDSNPPIGPPPSHLIDVADSSRTRLLDKPDFDDEYEIKGKYQQNRPQVSMSIGDDDLYPGGIKNITDHDPLRIGGRGNGMSPSFNHPLFGNRSSSSRGDHPFGARYDEPFGPGENDELTGQGLPGYRGTNNGIGFGQNNPFGGPPF